MPGGLTLGFAMHLVCIKLLHKSFDYKFQIVRWLQHGTVTVISYCQSSVSLTLISYLC